MPNQIMTNGGFAAGDFLRSFGVNAHTGVGTGAYGNSSLVLRGLNYLGITTVRDHFATLGTAGAVIEAVANAGVSFDFVVSSNLPAAGAAGLNSFVANLEAFQAKHPGKLYAVEGLNEANIQKFSYNGEFSMPAAAAYQKALYQAVKGSSSVGGIPVINLSVAMESPGAYQALGNLSAWSDYANAHAYTATNGSADAIMEASLARARAASSGDPTIITETGYTTLTFADSLGVSELAQARLTLTALLDGFENGARKTFLYELFDSNLDPQGAEKERHFGLFNADGSPKRAATAVHNLTTILSHTDTGPGANGVPQYQLGGMPTNAHAMLLNKTNGAYDIVLWRDSLAWDNAAKTDLTATTASVMIDLGAPQANVYVYDPIAGTQPIATYHNVSRISVPVGNNALIVEVGAAGPVTVVPPALPTDLTMTAASFVAGIDKLSAGAGLRTVTLSDGPVLPVASVATMRDMIGHYGNVLGKVAGGYQFRVTTNGVGWREEQAFSGGGTLLSTTDYVLSGAAVVSKHVVEANGTVSDYRYQGSVLVQRVVALADGSRTTVSYDGVTGKPVSRYEQIAGGDTISTLYKNGVVSSIGIVHPDGSKETDTFDANGAKLSAVTVDKAATWTTTQFNAATGKATRMFIQRADGSSENFAYGITGQSYVTQRQVSDKNGKVIQVQRTHADGSYDYTEVNDASGRTLAYYDAAGRKKSEQRLAAGGAKSTLTYDPPSGHLVSRVYQSANGDVATTLYTKGAATSLRTIKADGSSVIEKYAGGGKTIDSYAANGTKLTGVIIDAAGTWTTRCYDPASGALTKKYITYADGRAENYAYGITGRSYTGQQQFVDASGKVVEVRRTHADGTLDYTEYHRPDGSREVDTYDYRGRKLTASIIDAGGVNTSLSFDPVTAKLMRSVTRNPDGATIVGTYQNGVIANVSTTASNGSAWSVAYDAKKHDLAAVKALTSRYDATLFDSGDHVVRGTAANELLLVDTRGATLAGRGGDDRFYVRPGIGSGTISDFGTGHDLLDLSAFSAMGYKPSTTFDGQNGLLSFGNGDTITLTGVDPSKLSNAGQSAGVYALR